MMTPEERKGLFLALGEAMLKVQDTYKDAGHPVTEVVPEVMTSLLTLAGCVARDGAQITSAQFLGACHVVAIELYEKEDSDGPKPPPAR